MLNTFLNKKQKNHQRYMGAKMYIADMETNGVYFSEEQSKILQAQREKSMCQYSGLPSVASYVDETDYFVGHS